MTTCDTIAKIALAVGAITLIVGYWNYARPVFYGIKFEAGMCNYSQLTLDFKDKSCSCGKSCTGYYPCLHLTGFYMVNKTENSTQSNFNGTFYKDYTAVKAKCLVVPACSGSSRMNSDVVYDFFFKWIMPYVDDTRFPSIYNITKINYNKSSYIPCYGRHQQMYFEMTYALWKAIVALAVPGGACITGVIITLTCSSSEHKETVWTLVGFPLIVIIAILTGIADLLGIRNCFRRCSGTATTPSTSSVPGTPTIELASVQRRNSLVITDNRLSTTSFDSGDLPLSFNYQHNPHYHTTDDYSAALHNSGAPYGATHFDPPPVYDNGNAPAPPPPSYNDVMSGTSWRDATVDTFPTGPASE